MTKMLLCCAALLALGACATGGDLKGDLDSLVGQPVQKAIDRLGPPAATSGEADGDRTYVWESNYDVQYSTSQPANSLGVRDPNDMAGDTSPGAASSNDAPTNYRCFVRITASSAGLIKATAWGGNGDGCAAYAARLR